LWLFLSLRQDLWDTSMLLYIWLFRSFFIVGSYSVTGIGLYCCWYFDCYQSVLIMKRAAINFFFFFLVVLGFELRASYWKMLYVLSHPQPFCVSVIFQIAPCCLRLWSSYLYLLHSWDCRHEPILLVCYKHLCTVFGVSLNFHFLKISAQEQNCWSFGKRMYTKSFYLYNTCQNLT
jgi:hypothetical protein